MDISRKKNTPAIAVFEKAGFFSGFLLYRHLVQGHTVRYFRCSPSFEKKGFLKKYFDNGRLQRIIPGEIELASQTKLNNEVLDSVDQVYNDHFANKNFVRQAENCLESPHVNAAFKKELSLKMLEKYQIFQGLDSLSGNFFAPVYYYPEDTFYKTPYNYFKIRNLIESHKILIPVTGKVFAVLSDLREKLYWLLLFAAFPFWILLQSGFFQNPDVKIKDFRLGIRIYGNDYGFTPKYRSIDFLVNETCPSGNDTLFCIETDISQKYRKKFNEKGYHVVEIRKILKKSNIFSVGKYVICEIIPVWIKSVPSLLSQRSFLLKLFIEIQHKKLLWNTFLKKYSMKHYVTYNDTMAGDTIRNILFEKHGVGSWYFIHSIDNFDHYTPKTEGKLFREVLYSFLCYDHLVVWGDNSEQYYRSCPNYIRHYDKLGCLWSEHVSWVRQHPETNDVLGSVQKHFHDITGTKKIISVYDTTAGGAQMPLQAGDIRAFIDGIVQVLEKFPEVGVIFKMKNPVWYMQEHLPEILEMYQKLIRHPRCYTTTESQSDPSEVTAISDLVLSACFTSVTVEALGARKRAIYYDATGKFRNLYFDRFPRFVAHDIGELIDLVRYWLYENSEQEFNTFLETYIKGELESYLDGKAITRFRERICG